MSFVAVEKFLNIFEESHHNSASHQYDYNYKTFNQSIDISITKHLFTGHDWNSSLIQPPIQVIPLGHGLGE